MASGLEGIEGPAQIEFRFHRDGQALELGELVDRTFQIERFRGLVQATVAFGLWLQGVPSLTERGQLLAHRLLQDLRLQDSGLRFDDISAAALHQMIAEVVPVYEAEGRYGAGLRFDFAGAYRLNPTGFRFEAYGAPFALLVLAGICGCTIAYREKNAEACEGRVHTTERLQFEGLERIHRRQGRWTADLAESHRRVVQSSRLAARECHAIFPDVEIAISFMPRPSFEVRIKQHPEDPFEHPTPGH